MALSKELMDKIYSLNKIGIKLGLDNMHKAVMSLGLDLGSSRYIHIAGTNGKGSTAATLYSLIRTLRPKANTALYTSPHLIEYNERIIVNDKMIEDNEIESLSNEIFESTKDIPLTFFEFTTMLALMYFKKNEVDYAVIETGLGGRLDATNIIRPDVAIITSIDMDHTEYLGKDLTSIALEKAGIFKAGSKAVISRTNCSELLENEAFKKGLNPIYTMGRNFNYRIKDGGSFDLIKDNEVLYMGLRKTLNGQHQYKNTCCAIMGMDLLDIRSTTKDINKALNNVSWKGRLEEISFKDKTLLVDVSHNKEGMLATADFIRSKYPDKKIYTACGFVNDKDYRAMIDIIASFSEKIFLIPTNINGRELRASDYNDMALKHRNKAIICKNHQDAYEKAVHNDGIILFTGSIYNYEYINIFLGSITK